MYFKELSLPHNVLVESEISNMAVQKTVAPDYITIHYDVQRFINPNVVKILQTLGLTPTFFVHFGLLGKQQNQSSIHADIAWKTDHWHHVPFAINWEITPGLARMEWWDTKDTELFYGYRQPDNYVDDPKLFLNGLHPGENNKAFDRYELLNTLEFTTGKPYLLRTDIPHSLYYNTPAPQRICISLRFPWTSADTWNEAVELFRPLFVD